MIAEEPASAKDDTDDRQHDPDEGNNPGAGEPSYLESEGADQGPEE